MSDERGGWTHRSSKQQNQFGGSSMKGGYCVGNENGEEKTRDGSRGWTHRNSQEANPFGGSLTEGGYDVVMCGTKNGET